MMNEREKSDRPVVPMKPANDAKDFWSFVEELAEGRGLAKENGRDQDDREEHGTPPAQANQASQPQADFMSKQEGPYAVERGCPEKPLSNAHSINRSDPLRSFLLANLFL